MIGCGTRATGREQCLTGREVADNRSHLGNRLNKPLVGSHKAHSLATGPGDHKPTAAFWIEQANDSQISCLGGQPRACSKICDHRPGGHSGLRPRETVVQVVFRELIGQPAVESGRILIHDFPPGVQASGNIVTPAIGLRWLGMSHAQANKSTK